MSIDTPALVISYLKFIAFIFNHLCTEVQECRMFSTRNPAFKCIRCVCLSLNYYSIILLCTDLIFLPFILGSKNPQITLKLAEIRTDANGEVSIKCLFFP